MRGRKPRPSVVNALNGYPGKRRRNRQEPQPPMPADHSFDTPPPDVLENTTASAEWRRLAPMLRQCRQITEADRAALIALCLEWARYLDAMKEVRVLGLVVKAPSGYPITNPFLAIATKALANCNRLWPELGLTPSSRSRVKVEGSGPGPEGDAFSEFDVTAVGRGGVHAN